MFQVFFILLSSLLSCPDDSFSFFFIKIIRFFILIFAASDLHFLLCTGYRACFLFSVTRKQNTYVISSVDLFDLLVLVCGGTNIESDVVFLFFIIIPKLLFVLNSFLFFFDAVKRFDASFLLLLLLLLPLLSF